MGLEDIIVRPTGVGASTATKYTRLYNNPHFDYLTEMLPRDVKDMFRWAEVVYHNTPVIVNAARKLITYPITEINYKSESPKVRQNTQDLLEGVLDIKTHMLNLGLEYYIYGNAFRSLYYPFTRFLKCGRCNTLTNVRDAAYEFKRNKFILSCGECKHHGVAAVEDKFSEDISGLRIVSWDPKQMELSKNIVTDESTYYYVLHKMLISQILNGQKNIVESMPEVFFRATANSYKAIQFNDNLYHFKAPTLSGFQTGWGISPLIPTMKLYMYIAVLRKSSEAIGMEHITPQRIVFPQATTSDPTIGSSMGQWKQEITKAFDMWRRDPNYIMMAPYPTGVVNVGSQGRTLMPTQEIKQAEEDMVRALDIPTDFIFGTTNLNNSPVALRMLENQLRPYMSQANKYLNWLIKCINSKYDKEYCEVEFTPFKLADDIMEKQVLISLANSGVSNDTILKSFGLKPDDEREKRIEETIQAHKDEREVREKLHEEESNAAIQAKEDVAAANTGTVPQYDQQRMIQTADQVSQELLGMGPEERKMALGQLRDQDFVLYSVVKTRMEQMTNNGSADVIKQQTGQPTKADKAAMAASAVGKPQQG